MILQFDTNDFDMLKVEISDEEMCNVENTLCELPLALATLTIKFMQNYAPAHTHMVLQEVLLDLYKEYLLDWINSAQSMDRNVEECRDASRWLS